MTTWYRGEDIKQDGVLDVERRLGQGGMGCVLFARNKEDGTAVAIKVAKEVHRVERNTVKYSYWCAVTNTKSKNHFTVRR